MALEWSLSRAENHGGSEVNCFWLFLGFVCKIGYAETLALIRANLIVIMIMTMISMGKVILMMMRVVVVVMLIKRWQ